MSIAFAHLPSPGPVGEVTPSYRRATGSTEPGPIGRKLSFTHLNNERSPSPVENPRLSPVSRDDSAAVLIAGDGGPTRKLSLTRVNVEPSPSAVDDPPLSSAGTAVHTGEHSLQMIRDSRALLGVFVEECELLVEARHSLERTVGMQAERMVEQWLEYNRILVVKGMGGHGR